jgi:hypothetical protein
VGLCAILAFGTECRQPLYCLGVGNETKYISEGIPIAIPIETRYHNMNGKFIGPPGYKDIEIVKELALVYDNYLIGSALH